MVRSSLLSSFCGLSSSHLCVPGILSLVMTFVTSHRGHRQYVVEAGAANPDRIHSGLIEWEGHGGLALQAKMGKEEE